MIKDKLENIDRYTINENFQILKERIRNFDGQLKKLELPFKAIPLEYQTRKFDLSKFENHERNIDIHYIIEGIEQIGLNSTKELQPATAYNEEGDYQIFRGKVNDLIILQKGEFLILFPGEAHVTAGSYEGENKVSKIVLKVPIGK